MNSTSKRFTALCLGFAALAAVHRAEATHPPPEVVAVVDESFATLEVTPWEIELPATVLAPTEGATLRVPLPGTRGEFRADALDPGVHAVVVDSELVVTVDEGSPRIARVLVEFVQDGQVQAARLLPVSVGRLKKEARWLDSSQVTEIAPGEFISTKAMASGTPVASALVAGIAVAGEVHPSIEAAFDDIEIRASARAENTPDKSVGFTCMLGVGSSPAASITWATTPQITSTTTVVFQQIVASGQPTRHRIGVRLTGNVLAQAASINVAAGGSVSCGVGLSASPSVTVAGVTLTATAGGVLGLTAEANAVAVALAGTTLRVDGLDLFVGAEQNGAGAWRNLSYLTRPTPSFTLGSPSVTALDFSLRAGVYGEAKGTAKVGFLPLASFRLAQVNIGSGIYAKFAAPFDHRSPAYTGPEIGLEGRVLVRALDFGGWLTKIIGIPQAPVIEIDQRYRPTIFSPRVAGLSASQPSGGGTTTISGRFDRFAYFPVPNARAQVLLGPAGATTLRDGPSLVPSSTGAFSGSATVAATDRIAATRIFGSDPLSSRWPYAGPTATASVPAPAAGVAPVISSISPSTITVANTPQVITLYGQGFAGAFFHAGFGTPSNAASSYGDLLVLSDTTARLTLSATAQRQTGALGFAVRPSGSTVLPTAASATLRIQNPAPAGLAITGSCRRLLNCGANGTANAVISATNEGLLQTVAVPGYAPGSRYFLRAPGASTFAEVIGPLFTLGGGPNRYRQGIVQLNGSLLPTVGTYAVRVCNDVNGAPTCLDTALTVTN